jgi:arginyl-tRNA synthetase
MSMRDQLAEAVCAAVGVVARSEGLDLSLDGSAVHLERPARREHGDWSTNVALVTAKRAGTDPRSLASALVEVFRSDLPPHVTSAELAGPGFINFRLDDGWLHDALAGLLAEGEEGYARPDVGHGETVQVEFISANPTGPIHVGNGWWGSYGDALARVLARTGHRVSREYYVNDTGGQIRALGESLLARHQGNAVPEGGYQGEYLAGLARSYDGPDDGRPVGGRADPRAHPVHPGLDRHRLRRVVLAGIDRGERRGGRDHRPPRREGTGLRKGRCHLVSGH